MPNRNLTVVMVLLALAVFAPQPASARRHLATGSPMFPNTVACLGFDVTNGTAGAALANTSSCKGFFFSPIWVIPIYLDTSGTKTVKLTTKQSAANQLTCYLAEFDTSGAVVEVISYGALPVGGYASTSKSISVATGNTLAAFCSFNQNDPAIDQARVNSVEY